MMIINCDDGIITKFSEQAMAPEMEERGPVSNQMKTEKGDISNGPTKTDETMKTDEGKKSGDQFQNGQLRTTGAGKDDKDEGNKKEKEQGRDSGEESLLRRIIRRLSMKKKKKRKGKKSAVEKEREDNSKAELDAVEPKIVEEVNIEVTLSEHTSST